MDKGVEVGVGGVVVWGGWCLGGRWGNNITIIFVEFNKLANLW